MTLFHRVLRWLWGWGWLCALGLAQAQHQATRWPTHVAVPPIEFTDLSAQTWGAERFKGKTVVINFWATWCAPCLEELPSLQTFADFNQTSDITVLTVNVKDPLNRVRQFVVRNQFSFPVVADRQGVLARQWGVKVFPTTIILSPQGVPTWIIEGAVDWTDQRVQAWMPLKP